MTDTQRRTITIALGLLLAALIGLPGVFLGFDIADSGFYLTFYDNFYRAPATVSYNFMYYMSGVLGGTLQEAFPAMGMAGMRVAGLALCLLSLAIVAAAHGKRLPAAGVAAGMVLVTAAFLPPLYTLSYDIFTVCFYCCAIALIASGCDHNGSWWRLALAGAMLAMNTMSRIPNVLSLALMAAIIVHARRNGCTWRCAAVRCLWLLAGYLAAMAAIVAWMRAMGHWDLMCDNLLLLRSIAADDSGTASHTTTQLITTQLKFYATLLWCAVKLGACAVALWAAGKLKMPRWARWTLTAVALAGWVFFTARMRILEPLWLMAAVACAFYWLRGKGKTSTLACAALIMMVVMPLGSDGAYNNGAVIAWAAAPVAGAFWWRGRRRALYLVFVAVCLVRMVTGGAYFDDGSLLHKTAAIHNPRAEHIFTTPERAAIVNDLLAGIAPHVHAGDTLMAYGSLPTVNYLTATRPFLGCSWVEQLSAATLEKSLSDHLGESPLILRQKFSTLSGTWPPPSDEYLAAYDHESPYQDNRKLDVLNRYMLVKGYRTIWENSYFALYAPASH